MSITVTVQEAITGLGAQINNNNIYTDSASLSISETIADAVTDGQIAFSLDVSEIAVIYINSSQDILLETVANGTGVNISLLANVPYIWKANGYLANLFTDDTTDLFFTNTSGSTANIEIRCVYDSSP